MSMSGFVISCLVAIVALAVVLWLLYRLILHPSAIADLEGGEPVVVTSTMNSSEAAVMLSKLHAFGLPAYIQNTFSLGPYRHWFWPTWYRIFVRHGDVDEARRLLQLEAIDETDTP